MLTYFFSVTVGCLVLRQRYRRNLSSSYSNLIPPTNEANRITRGRNVVDVEDLVSPVTNTPLGPNK